MAAAVVAELKGTCAVVICTRNRPDELEACLSAVFRQTSPPSQVIVVDSAPSDSRTRQVALRWGVGYEEESLPGLSRARNRGARACRSEFVAFLDDDCLPEPDWLTSLLAEFQDPNTTIVTGRVLSLGPIVELAGGEGPTFCDRRVVHNRSPQWFEMANFGGAGDGGNMALRRSAFDRWPGFDERLGRGAPIDGNEEHYAFFQLIDRGHKLVYSPNAVVRHPCGDTVEKVRERLRSQARATAAFMALLIAEHPRYRRRVLRYIVEALWGARRSWREVEEAQRRLVSRWRYVAPALSGLALYLQLRMLRRTKRSGVPSSAQEPLPTNSSREESVCMRS